MKFLRKSLFQSLALTFVSLFVFIYSYQALAITKYENSLDNVLRGGEGNDWLYGGEGNDRLYGGEGNDSLYGGEGNDWLYGGEGDDRLYGDRGDRLSGDRGDDGLSGGEGDDWLWGNGGDDWLLGDGGDDWLWGNGGDDRLYGGEGDDGLFGGYGDDYFGFYGKNGFDIIKDFTDQEDSIVLSWYMTSYDQLDIKQEGRHVIILLDGLLEGAGVIQINDFSLDNLSADDFVF